MLFKTIDEIKNHVAVTTGLSFATIKMEIKRAERKYLLPYLGSDQYEALNTAYNSAQMTTAQTALLDYARDVVAPFAISQSLPIIQVQINDAGIQNVDTQTEKNAQQWKVDMLNEDYLLKNGWEAIEELMKFLENNADDYPLWAADETASTIHKQFIINTASEFNDYYWINNSPLTFKALVPSMKKVQLLDLAGGPGDALTERILTEIASGTLSDDINAIMKWVKPLFANLVINRAINELQITVRPDGVYSNSYKTNDNSNNKERLAATTIQLEFAKEAWKQAHEYREPLLAYLQENASADHYPEFFESDLYTTEETPAAETVDCCDCGTCSQCVATTSNPKFYRIGKS